MAIEVAVCSDTHLDFYERKLHYNKLVKLVDDHFTVEADVIIIAGDISHYNQQIAWFCEILRARYEAVFLVAGNHEFYNISNTQRRKFRNTYDKLNELKGLIEPLSDVHLLDGNIVEFRGVKFGGAMGWYDGQLSQGGPYGPSVDTLWRHTMNDSLRIPKVDTLWDILEVELPKVEAVFDKCDVMVTHITPTLHLDFIAEEFRNSNTNGFYTFDFEERIIENGPKFWVSGHQHDAYAGMIGDTQYIRNPFGYPAESGGFKMVTFTVDAVEDIDLNEQIRRNK